jgi:hypothetical protein
MLLDAQLDRERELEIQILPRNPKPFKVWNKIAILDRLFIEGLSAHCPLLE